MIIDLDDGPDVYDPVTLDQLRAFVTVIEEGSFSAAARKLKRVQSAISTSMANLETHLGVRVWDRTTKVAKLTGEGRSVLAAAHRVLGEADVLRRLASGMSRGLEPQVSLCLDALFPLSGLIELATAFNKQFPDVDLRVDTQVLSAVSARVLDGTATLGVSGPTGIAPGLDKRVLSPIRLVAVCSPRHPLAAIRGRVPKEAIAKAIQIVLSERQEVGVEDQGVLSPRTWRVADLHTKHEMLRAGLGWGNLPEHLVRGDLKARRLVVIRPDAWGDNEQTLYLSAIYRAGAVFGPAHGWLLDNLGTVCAHATSTKPHRRGR